MVFIWKSPTKSDDGLPTEPAANRLTEVVLYPKQSGLQGGVPKNLESTP
jgi:hypothetical protein